MGAQAVRRHAGLKRLGCAAALLAAATVQAATTYDDGPTLARRLLATVVRVDAQEHGFGMLVGADRDFLYIATARHVVSGAERITLQACDAALPGERAAQHIAAFDLPSDDLALLRTPRPAGFQAPTRALAPPEEVAPTDPAWLLGRDDSCTVLPRAGAVAARPNARALWRVDMPGVLGGSSGAPVTTGRGVIGLTTDSDNANITVLDATLIARRVQAHGAPFDLVKADNIPPLDPQAAAQDLAEMLNRYLFELRDAQTVLRQPTAARATFTQAVNEYNVAAERFRDAKDKYDGTLRQHWEPAVAQQWAALRDRLWAAHERFLFVNEHARSIVQTERIPAVVQERMAALDPELSGIQTAISQFLNALSQKEIVHAKPPP